MPWLLGKTWLWITRIGLEWILRLLCTCILPVVIKVEEIFWNELEEYKDTICKKGLTSSSSCAQEGYYWHWIPNSD